MLFTFVMATASVAASSADSLAKVRSPRELRAAFDVGWVFGISATEFFADYRALLGAPSSGFDAPTAVNFNASSFIIADAPIGLSVGYYRAVVRETYDYDPDDYLAPTTARQTVSQDLQLTVIPAMVTFDFFPIERQFTTYVGAAAGLGFANVYWSESLSPSTEPRNRQSGLRYDEWQVAPSIAVRAGVSLGFDKRLALRARAGIYVEGGYLNLPISGEYFAQTGATLAYDVPRTQGTYSIQAGGVIVRIGFSVLLSGN